MQTTTDAEAVSVQRARASLADPVGLMDHYQPDNTHYVIAARVRGRFPSAFPERAGESGHIAVCADRAEVIVVADTDVLSNRLWVSYAQNLFGQPQLSAIADNGDFVTHIVDSLSGTSALLSIRGRTGAQRPFTRVLALQNVANQKFLAKKQELQRELAQTRSRLSALQSARTASGAVISAEQRSEIDQFLQLQQKIGEELRDVQHQLNADIDTLGLRLKVINIVLMPALVTLIGLLYGWFRMRRQQRAG